MIAQVRRGLPQRRLVLVVDGGLAAIKLGHRCLGYANPVTHVSRLRLDACLHDWPAPQPKGKRGPKPKKGSRQPALKARLTDPATVWQTITIDWYQGKQRTLEVATGLALWYTPGQPLPVRSTAWYTKSDATFSDVIACVRRHLWTHTEFVQSPAEPGHIPISATCLHGLVGLLCYTA